MERLSIPTQTSFARLWLQRPDAPADRVRQALLATVDGHRNLIELESFARALGLAPCALEDLRREGLIDLSDGRSAEAV